LSSANNLRLARLVSSVSAKLSQSGERSHEGQIWPHYGRFLQIDRPRLVEYTWVSEATKGIEFVVAVSFQPRGQETEVTLHHSNAADDERNPLN
jgi:hypothetical protein